jgi:hypothetical protein
MLDTSVHVRNVVPFALAMRNLFIQVEQPFATWRADLTSIADSPERVLDVVAATLEAGERHGVFVPVAATSRARSFRQGASGGSTRTRRAATRESGSTQRASCSMRPSPP